MSMRKGNYKMPRGIPKKRRTNKEVLEARRIKKEELQGNVADMAAQITDGSIPIRPDYYGCGQVHEIYKCLQAWGLKANAHLWTAVVYLARAGKKDPKKYIEDLIKAKTWIQIEIDEASVMLQAERTKTVGDPIGPCN